MARPNTPKSDAYARILEILSGGSYGMVEVSLRSRMSRNYTRSTVDYLLEKGAIEVDDRPHVRVVDGRGCLGGDRYRVTDLGRDLLGLILERNVMFDLYGGVEDGQV